MPNPTGHTDSIRNSQFKAAWQTGPTRTIRVPIALAEVTLEYARQLDQGIESRDTTMKADSQASKLDEDLATEPRDTSKSHTELEDAKADYVKLLESSTHITNKLREEVRELRSQLEAEKTRWDELREELDDGEEACAQLRSELSDLRQKSKIDDARKNFPDFPEAADLLNQLKGRRKKSRADFADMEAVLDVLAELGT